MIVLRDTVEIKASSEKIFEFFVHFKENFHAWHPDHVECRYLTNGPLGKGSIVYIEEYLHGKLHKLELHVTKIEPNSRIEYKVSPHGSKGIFILEPRGANSLFTAEIHIGSKIPLLGSVGDVFLRLFLSHQLKGIKRHMAEEGQNLKRILEEGIQ